MILYAVWLYARFKLSFRDVEEVLAERGVDATNETVRRWFLKFGRLVARNLLRSRPTPSPRWHLDEMVIKIRGRRHWLWRAVDDEGLLFYATTSSDSPEDGAGNLLGYRRFLSAWRNRVAAS